MSDPGYERYLHLLRWYPVAWRERNAAAVIGVLMDQADAAGRTGPSSSERRSLLVGGLQERWLRPSTGAPISIVGLVLSFAFSIFYFGVIGWSPGITYAGAIGPFTNPMIIVGIIQFTALVLIACKRAATARVLANGSIATAIVIGVLSEAFSWLGPSLPVVAAFVAFGLMARATIRNLSRAMQLLGLALALGIAATGYDLAEVLGHFSAHRFVLPADAMEPVDSVFLSIVRVTFASLTAALGLAMWRVGHVSPAPQEARRRT